MLTLNANWLAAFERGTVEPRVLAVYTPAAGPAYHFTDGDVTYINASAQILPIITRLSTLKRNMDPVSRKITVGKMVLSLAMDQALIDLIVANRLVGETIDIYLGARELAFADYEDLFTGGRVKKYKVNRGERRVEIEIENGVSWLAAIIGNGLWPGLHQLEILEDILERADTPTARWVPADYDPTQAVYTTISHLNCSSYTRDAGNRTGMEIFEEIAAMLDGSGYIDEQNRVRMALFNSAAAAIDDWTDDDILEINQVDATGPVLNSVRVVAGAVRDAGKPDYSAQYIRKDDDSIANWGLKELEIEPRWWLGPSYGQLYTAVTQAQGAGTFFTVVFAIGFAPSGTRWPGYPGGSQPASAQLSATRTAYLKIDSEIIEVDQVDQIAGQQNVAGQGVDPYDGSANTTILPTQCRFRIKTRGALGTSAAAHTGATDETKVIGTVTVVTGTIYGARVYDMTGAVLLAKSKVDRFHDGAPIVEVLTTLAKYAVQVGDLVTLTTGQYLAFGRDGLDTTFKWEIIGKEVDPHGGMPAIRWALMRAADSGAPAQSNSHTVFADRVVAVSVGEAQLSALTGGKSAYNHVLSGLTATQSGLNVTIAAGQAAGVGAQNGLDVAKTIAVANNSDTYLYWDLAAGELLAYNVATGAAEPTNLPHWIPLALAEASGGVVTLTDIRPTKALEGQRIYPLTVDTAELAADAVTAPKILDGEVAYQHLTLPAQLGSGGLFNVNLIKKRS